MKTIKQDRKELQRLVESYGKEDVMKYINYINESTDESSHKSDSIQIALQEFKQNPDNILLILEDLYDSGFDEGYATAKENSKKKIKSLEKQVSDAGWQYEYDHRDDWRTPREMGQW